MIIRHLKHLKNIYFYYQKNPDIKQSVKPLIEIANKNDIKTVNNAADANVIVSIGGDGAFLQAVRKTGFRQDCLYTGITPKDESGLYCDFSMDQFEHLLQTMKEEEIEVRRFPILKAQINGEASFYCLNELSIRSTIIKTIVIDVHIDDLHFETFRGDGLIVATPTGSTGYNKSIHGAVIDPLIPCLQVSELASLNNNRYRTLGSSFVLSKDRELMLKVVQDGNDHPVVGFDNEAYSIRNIHDVKVTLTDKVVKTIKLKDNSYWDRVKRTFL